MTKRVLIALATAAVLIGMSYAQQSTDKPGTTTINVNKTAANNGKQMYNSYCAPCHGTDGKGNGPVAPQLKQPATDLTVLAKNNGGKFPDAHLVAVMQFGSELQGKGATHGTAQMPVWGPILGNMDQGSQQEKQLRISNISRYIQSLQVK
jgi:mono/diheme cytochrome c family protein